MLGIVHITIFIFGILIILVFVAKSSKINPKEQLDMQENKYMNGYKLKYNHIEIVKMVYEASTSRNETVNENVLDKLKKQTVPYLKYENDCVIIPWKNITAWRLEYQNFSNRNLFLLKFNIRGLDEEISIFAGVDSEIDSAYNAFTMYAPAVRLEGTTRI